MNCMFNDYPFPANTKKPKKNNKNFNYNNNFMNLANAPPIPSMYKQSIVEQVDGLPNLNLYSNPRNVAKSFSSNYQKLQEIENKLAKSDKNRKFPKINNNMQNLKDQLSYKAYEKYLSSNDPDLLEHFQKLRELKSQLQIEKEKGEKIRKERIKKKKIVYSNETRLHFKNNLANQLNSYLTSIHSDLEAEKLKSKNYIEIIKSSLGEFKEHVDGQLNNYENQAAYELFNLKNILLNKNQDKRVKDLTSCLFEAKKNIPVDTENNNININSNSNISDEYS